jgi:NADPH2:quinone reductase
VGSEEKAQLARENGCTHVVNYRTEDYVARVKEITGGKGCDVVYDGVGKDTFPSSLDCLKPKGLWVSFGNASGPVPPFEITLLSAKGSLYATRPTLFAYVAARADLLANAAELIDMIVRGAVKIRVSRTYPLRDAAAAHRDLEARKTTGSIVLTA